MIAQIQSFLIAHPLVELSMVIAVLVVSGYAAKALRQPVLVGYIFGGVLLSPQVLDLIVHQEQLETYAHFGVSLLLFMVGLGLNPHIIREVGKVSIIAGVGQVAFTSLLGYGIARLLGYGPISALYLAIALTFSSTIVIVKLISDRGDGGTLYGKIALGVLIIQDIIAMLILMAISATMMEVGSQGVGRFVMTIVGKVVLLGGITRAITHRLLPPLLDRLARTRELLLLFVIAWALCLGGVWYFAGFSMEIGALLAGISLASSHYRYHIFSELRPMRDFFIALFFVYLGSQILFSGIAPHLLAIVLLSLFVLIGNPLIVVTLMKKLGYTSKVGFMTGLTVAQISEFSFIVIGLAVTAGHITDPVILSVVTFIGLITMTGSSYLFAYADQLYDRLHPYLPADRQHPSDPTTHTHTTSYDIVLVGYARIGRYLAQKYREHHKRVLVVDHDPAHIAAADKAGFATCYGDINDEDLLEEVLDPQISLVCSTVDDYDSTINLLRIVNELTPDVAVLCLAMYFEEAEEYYRHGAQYVILPHLAGAHHTRGILEQHIRAPESFITHRLDAIEQIKQYKRSTGIGQVS